MAIVLTHVLTDSAAWIVGLLGISAMAFFLGCAGCRQHKPREAAGRRLPPPTPESDHHPRYQEELYPPSSSQDATYSFPTKTSDNDYEDDFIELPPQDMSDQLKSLNSCATTPTCIRDTSMRSSLESEDKVSPCHSYENVINVQKSLGCSPVMGKDHTYLEVFPSSDTELELTTADIAIMTSIRSSVESEGKVSMLSQNSRHSYENVTQTNGSPSSALSELEGDYVNLQ